MDPTGQLDAIRDQVAVILDYPIAADHAELGTQATALAQAVRDLDEHLSSRAGGALGVPQQWSGGRINDDGTPRTEDGSEVEQIISGPGGTIPIPEASAEGDGSGDAAEGRESSDQAGTAADRSQPATDELPAAAADLPAAQEEH